MRLKLAILFGVYFVTFLSISCGASKQSADDEQTEDSGSDTATDTDAGLDSDSATDSQLDTETESDTTPDCVHPEVVKDCENGWCRIPPGCFIGGSPVDEMGHAKLSERETPVTLTRAFSIKQTEVTQKEWTEAGFPNNSFFGPNGNGECSDPTCPMEYINWFEAVAYANRMSELNDPPLPRCYDMKNCQGNVGEGMVCESVTVTSPTIYECKGFRLPTTAESEYATRAGAQTAFHSGPIKEYVAQSECNPDPSLEKIAWYCYNSEGKSHPVGQKEPNAWGLYDASGNVFEWVDSKMNGFGYGVDPITDPLGAVDATDHSHAARGGVLNGWSTICRSAFNFELNAGTQAYISTRLVRTLD